MHVLVRLCWEIVDNSQVTTYPEYNKNPKEIQRVNSNLYSAGTGIN